VTEARVEALDPKNVIGDLVVKEEFVRPNRRVFTIDKSGIREAVSRLIKAYGETSVYVSTIAGVDRIEQGVMELNYFISILPRKEIIVLRTQVPRTQPAVDTLIDIAPGTFASESETFDLLGVQFNGNKLLKRGFFVPEDVTSKGVYPLRKDAKW
jgi:NADH-quinone oxidoreductase subunit C